MIKWRSVAAAAAVSFSFFLPFQGLAQDRPSGPIRYILHVEPGGATDVMARKLAEGLQAELGQNIIVENRSGGSGARQMAQMSRAAPDGLTIGSVTASHFGMFQQSGQFNVDSVEWACSLVLDPYLLAVRADSDIKTLEDLVGKSKGAPGSLSVAGFGEGSGGQIAWLMFEEAAALNQGDINWVPYNSVGDAVVAILGGHNDVVISYVGLVRQHVEAGTLRVIGVMSDVRAAMLPEVPTFQEAGFPVDTAWQQFRGVIMPKDTPLEAQEALCSAVRNVLAKPGMQKYIADSELIEGFMPPAEFDAFAHKQNEATIAWLERLKKSD